ncbi:hypothetical protein BDR05DRAFT_773115 [Suillus weaverae]|nr:hypothetical protein BDR05DRAFT_773115 [Suillus weaverae]
MTLVLNDPSFWPIINSNFFYSYWIVAAGVVVVYDWVLTLGQEIELIWKQRWSLMTVLYLVIRYIGIPYSGVSVLRIPLVSVGDAVSIPQPSHSHALNTFICRGNIMNYTINWTDVVVTALLGVIIIARLHAMYQRSRMMLILLVIIFLAVNIACGVIAAISLKYSVAEEFILSGTYMCTFEYEENFQLLGSIIWILMTVWEVLALCLSVWIAVKHFRDLRRLGLSTGSAIGDCFRVLIKSHVLYFASFVCVCCFQLGSLTPVVTNSNSMGVEILYGVCQILLVVQMFVLGPRLILSVREYHAKLVADFDAETCMTSIVFQEHVALHVPTSSTV